MRKFPHKRGKVPPKRRNFQKFKLAQISMIFHIIMNSNNDFYQNRSISFVMIRFVLSPPLLEVSPQTPPYPHNPQNMKFHIIMNSNTDFYRNRSISFVMIRFVLSPPLLEVSPKTPPYPHNPQNMKFHIIMNSNTDFYRNRSISFDMINFVQLETCPASLCVAR